MTSFSNTSKSSTTFTNTSKGLDSIRTWATILTTWATELDDWLGDITTSWTNTNK